MTENIETKIIKINLIRHGMTDGNKEHRYIGVTDEALSFDAKDYLSKKKYPDAQMIFISPLLRCRQTAEIVYPGSDYRVIPEIAEMNFGEFEGKNFNDLNGDIRYQKWIDEGGIGAFPGGENRSGFIKRTIAGMDEIIDVIMKAGSLEVSQVSIVAHGGTIMAVLSEKCGGEYFDYHVENGGYYMLTVEISADEWKVIKSKRG